MSETAKQSEEAKALAPAKKPHKEPEPVLYVGPTISGVAITGTVYNDIPEAAKVARKKASMFLNLFVPIKEYGIAEKMIREKTGYVYSAYDQALKLKKGGNN